MNTTEQKYILAPYVKIGFAEDKLELGFGSIQTTLNDSSVHDAIISLCSFFLSPHSLTDAENFLKLEHQLEDILLKEIISLFQTKNLLIGDGAYNSEDRYSRHQLFYNMSGAKLDEIQPSLLNRHVVILGCGGIGNIVGVNLATAGVGHLTLIDDDTIELSNLTRQVMFSESDIGNLKVDILKRELHKRASNIKISTLGERIHENGKNLPDNDLVVVSGDSKGIMKQINKVCYERNIPFINVGYIQDIAAWGPIFIPGKSGCYECFSKQYIAKTGSTNSNFNNNINAINSKYQAPSIGPVNMLAGSLASLDILKFLGSFGKVQVTNKRIGVWTHNLKIEEQVFENQQFCDLCRFNYS